MAMQDHIVHREVVAALASYKASLRSAMSMLQQQQQGAERLKSALERTSQAAAAAQKRLKTVSDQRLPLDTSRRLAEIDLASHVQQLLQVVVAESTSAAWSTSAKPAPASDDAAGAATEAVTWDNIQCCINECFECLCLLATVACRACTRSSEPLQVLEQLAAPGLAEGCVQFLRHIHAQASSAEGPAEVLAGAVAAPCSYYGPFAAALDALPVLRPIEVQLAAALSSAGYLPVAAELLLAARRPAAPVQVCQQGGHNLLTLALLLSGDSLVTQWQLDSPNGAGTAATSPTATSTSEQQQQPQQQPVFGAVCDQLTNAPVLEFLEERLYHTACELHCSSAVPELASIVLLPGRAVLDGSMELLAAALRVLRVWRAILRSSSAQRSRFAATPRTSQLLLSMLSAALADPVRAVSTDRQSLRSRVCKVCIDCLQMLAGRLAPDALLAVLRPLLVDCTGMLVAVAQFVDVHRHAAKSSDLPYSARLKTMDRATSDVLQRYCATAEQAVDIVQAVLRSTVSCEEHSPLTSACIGVLMASGMLPALEGVFRTIPPACQAHVAAAELLVHLLPHWSLGADTTADASGGGSQSVLSLLITLRKFLVNCSSLPEPDREPGVHVALAAEALLTRLVRVVMRGAPAKACSGECHELTTACSTMEDRALLLRHAVQQLLPAIQGMCAGLLKAPSSGAVTCVQNGSSQHLFLYLFKLLRQLAQLHAQHPDLQLLPLLAINNSLPLAAAMLATVFYAAPQGFSLLGEQPSSCSSTTQEYLAKQCLLLLEHCTPHLLAAAPKAATAAQQPAAAASAAATVGASPPQPVKPSADAGGVVVEVLATAGSAGSSADGSRSATPAAATIADPAADPWRAQLLSGVLHSRLLAEVQRLLLQLAVGPTEEGLTAAVGAALSDAGSLRRTDSFGVSPAGSGMLLERGASGRLAGRPINKSDSWGGLQSTWSGLSLNSARGDSGLGSHSQPGTPAGSAMRDMLPLAGVSIPNINTRPLHREGSGSLALLRGTSPTAFTAGLGARAGPSRSRGATPVAASAGLGGLQGSYSSLSSLGSGIWGGGAPTSPVAGTSNFYFDSMLRTSSLNYPAAARGVGVSMDAGANMAVTAAVTALQQRLDRLLVQVGEAVLQLSGPPPLAPAAAAGVNGGEAGAGAAAAGPIDRQASAPASGVVGSAPLAAPGAARQDVESLQRAMSSLSMPLPAVSRLSDALRSGGVTPRGSPRTGADASPVASGPRDADRFGTLRGAVAAALDAMAQQEAAAAAAAAAGRAAAAQGRSGSISPAAAGMSAGGVDIQGGRRATTDMAGLAFALEGASDHTFGSGLGASPTDSSLLGADTMAAAVHPAAAGEVAAAAASQPQEEPGDAVPLAVALPPPLLRRLLAGLTSATPPALQLLEKTAGQACGDLVLAGLRPLPLGCWHTGCTLLAGVSESKAALRPCSGCGVAVYCSKACEKSAWSSHKAACSHLKAQLEAGRVPAAPVPEVVVVRRSHGGSAEARGSVVTPRLSRVPGGF